ncbi:MAG: hypothetical protein D6732_25240 [Methanobacteriota archaeon]|nr:MAG: hypothetical protein D6732_25240 [Euryarchaeota archaeon]
MRRQIRTVWRNSKLIKRLVATGIIIMLGGLVIRSSVANPNTIGTVVLGDRENEQQIKTGQTLVYQGQLTNKDGGQAFFGMAATEDLKYFVSLLPLFENETDATLEEKSFLSGSNNKVSEWIEVEFTSIYVALRANKDARLLVGVVYYNQAEMKIVQRYSLGDLIMKAGIFLVVVSIIILAFRAYRIKEIDDLKERYNQ